MEKIICKICQKEFDSSKAFAGHLASHRMSMKEYYIKYFFEGVHPTCHFPDCKNETLFVRGKNVFREYCPEHGSYARKKWSKENGFGAKQNAGWKKGLTKEDHSGIAVQSKKMKGENNPWFGKKHSSEVIERITKKRIEKVTLSKEKYEKKDVENGRFKFVTPYKDYIHYRRQKLKVRCLVCGKEQLKSIYDIHQGGVCVDCKTNCCEREIEIFLKSIEINFSLRDRKVIYPSELDFWAPNEKIAIEYNGLYWHSERTKPKDYHYKKTKICEEKGIQLIHIFSDEWDDKKEIIKSIIKNKFKKTENRIFARKCELKEIDNKVGIEFLNKNHISGGAQAKKTFALFLDEEIVSVLSLRIPFYQKYKGSIEISRFASKLDTNVIGGFSKLFEEAKRYAINEEYASIISYADLRFGNGNVYAKNGFSLEGKTVINYWYTNGKERFNRFKFRAANEKTEKQVAEDAGVFRVFGPGNNLYKFFLSP